MKSRDHWTAAEGVFVVHKGGGLDPLPFCEGVVVKGVGGEELETESIIKNLNIPSTFSYCDAEYMEAVNS